MRLRARVVVARPGFTLDVELDAASVCEGGVIAVLGPNGAGKSTLLRALAGLEPLTSGRIALGDRVLEAREAGAGASVRLAPAARRVGVVFADHRLFPHLSALENVAFGPRATGTPRRAAREAARSWLARLGLEELRERRPGQLSGGQAQRVALARVLATRPHLLALDEPLAALDAGTRDDVRALLREQLSGFGGPCLLVTHDVVDALALADRVLVLEGGRLVQDDAPAVLVRRPRTRYVAGLVGLTLLAGRVEVGGALAGPGAGAGARFLVDDADGGGCLLLADGARPTGDALAAIRPAAVRVRPPGGAATSAASGAHGQTWTSTVTAVDALGDRVRLALAGPPSLTADLDLAAATALAPRVGQALVVDVDARDVDVYPR